jgi:hypothetical protein
VTYRGPWDKPTANPILVIGNTRDPATPFTGSVKMVKQLADAQLLTVDGYGHTAFLNPSTCANQYTVAYLVGGTLPPPRTVCSQDAAPFTGGSTFERPGRIDSVSPGGAQRSSNEGAVSPIAPTMRIRA